jgi:RHS repeat-associated protein
LVNTYIYDAFGNVAASTGAFTNPFQYTGRDSDTETGLRYYRARYYDPQIGRFLSQDPGGFSGGKNFYSYARNAPNKFYDPLGLCTILVGYHATVDLPLVFPMPWGMGDLPANHTYVVLKDSKGIIIFTAYANTFMLFPTTLGATTGQVIKGFKPTEPIDEDPLIKVSDDCRSCDDYLKVLQNFEDLINASNISYHAVGGPNSNSATSTALQKLGINWIPPFWAPGWGAPVPIKSH